MATLFNNSRELELDKLGAELILDRGPGGSARVTLRANVPALTGGSHTRLIQRMGDDITETIDLAIVELRELLAVRHAHLARLEADRHLVGAPA